jgi:hypothetical protein
MKHELFLTDFLLIHNSVSETLVQKAIDNLDEPHKLMICIVEICENMDLTGMSFDSHAEQYNVVRKYVDMINDVFEGKLKYSIVSEK